MNYQTSLEDKKSSEATSLFLAIKTKNIFEVDHLVEKGYIPAILKRLEFAALKNDQNKISVLSEKALELVESEADKILVKKDILDILDKNLPNIAKKQSFKI